MMGLSNAADFECLMKVKLRREEAALKAAQVQKFGILTAVTAAASADCFALIRRAL